MSRFTKILAQNHLADGSRLRPIRSRQKFILQRRGKLRETQIRNLAKDDKIFLAWKNFIYKKIVNHSWPGGNFSSSHS
jgi:CRISPR/Cas system-associated endonuclease Cas1